MAVANFNTTLPTQLQSTAVTAVDPGSLGFFGTVSITVPGLPAASNSGLRVIAVTGYTLETNVFVVGWQITAANTLVCLLYNNSGSPIDPAACTFEVLVA